MPITHYYFLWTVHILRLSAFSDAQMRGYITNINIPASDLPFLKCSHTKHILALNNSASDKNYGQYKSE
jgi:hypothetical protein